MTSQPQDLLPLIESGWGSMPVLVAYFTGGARTCRANNDARSAARGSS